MARFRTLGYSGLASAFLALTLLVSQWFLLSPIPLHEHRQLYGIHVHSITVSIGSYEVVSLTRDGAGVARQETTSAYLRAPDASMFTHAHTSLAQLIQRARVPEPLPAHRLWHSEKVDLTHFMGRPEIPPPQYPSLAA